MGRTRQLADDAIAIYPSKYNQRVQVASYNLFFKDSVICKVKHDHLEFTKPTIDYQGKVKTPNEVKSIFRFHIMEDLPGGHFSISDESDEDTIIVYFSDKIEDND